MTDEELRKISEAVADLVWQKAKRYLTKKVDFWLVTQYNRIHPEKLLKREDFLTLPENKFYNYKTKKQIKGIKAINVFKEHMKQFPQDDLVRYYATQPQFYSIKRKVKDEFLGQGVSCSTYTGSGYIATYCYNYHQTIPIDDKDWIEPINRQKARNKVYKNTSQRKKILMSKNFTCANCGGVFPPEKLEIDHIIPISLGGSSTSDNLQVLCIQCNRKKGAKKLDN